MKKCWVIVFLLAAGCSSALDTGEHRALVHDHPVAGGYMLRVPAGYSGNKAWPVILSLHSAAEVGGPVERALEHGPPAVAVDREEAAGDFLRNEFIIISFHMNDGAYEERQWYLYTGALNDILGKAGEEYRLDGKRLHRVGYSTGAAGVWGG